MEKENEFLEILKKEQIRAVYQPIVSLKDGSVLGYEALSRITKEGGTLKVDELFCIAERINMLWELELLCRSCSLKSARNKLDGTKLFLNVDPKVIHDKQFRRGMTREYLEKFKLKSEDIVFEITERTSIEDAATFQQTIHHYREQGFEIAIDDFGEGYSGINRICTLSPNYVKIDMAVVRNIDTDTMKQSLVESFVQFCKASSIKLIAEGIETKEELKMLIRLGVAYGQGYYIQRPISNMFDVSINIKNEIRSLWIKDCRKICNQSLFGKVGNICKPKQIVHRGTMAIEVYKKMKKDDSISEYCILDEKERVMGMLTRDRLLTLFGGQYGYHLHSRKLVEELMDKEVLIVDEETFIENVSTLAMSRPMNSIYDAVIVTSQGRYKGMATVKDLLETAIKIQISKAIDSSPLTGLPGNSTIQNEIDRVIINERRYAVIYIDMDNFKAYNDAYGFKNGDMMIKALAGCIQEQCSQNEFVGHIGGDDFVIITNYWDTKKLCKKIIDQFSSSIRSLYSKDDWEAGCIVSKNRKGEVETFPVVTISIGIVTNRNKDFQRMELFSEDIVKAKKQAKAKKGNSVVVI